MNLNIAIVRPLRDMFSALTESVNKVFDHSEYTTDHLECFGFVLRVFVLTCGLNGDFCLHCVVQRIHIQTR